MVVYYPHRVGADDLDSHNKGNRQGSNPSRSTLRTRKQRNDDTTGTSRDTGDSRQENYESPLNVSAANAVYPFS